MRKVMTVLAASQSIATLVLSTSASAQPIGTPATISPRVCFIDTRKVEQVLLAKAGVDRSSPAFKNGSYEKNQAYLRAKRSFEAGSAVTFNKNQCVAVMQRMEMGAYDLTPAVEQAINSGMSGPPAKLVFPQSQGFCSGRLEGAGGGVDRVKLQQAANAVLAEKGCRSYLDESQVFGGGIDPRISISKDLLIRIESLRVQGTAANRPCNPATIAKPTQPICFAVGPRTKAVMGERSVKIDAPEGQENYFQETVQFYASAGQKVRVLMEGQLSSADSPIWSTFFGPYDSTVRATATGRANQAKGIHQFWREFVVPASGNWSTNIQSDAKNYVIQISIVG